MATYRILAWSAPGQGKSTFALRGGGKKWYAQLDSGSYQRAIAGFPIDESTITKEDFFVPMTALTDSPKLDKSMVGAQGRGPVQFIHRLEGWSEKLDEFKNAYVKALFGDYETIIIDTASRLWELARRATQQRVQEEYPPSEWQAQLKRAEYQEPNWLIDQVIETADQQGKNLVLLAHEKEKWSGGNPTGLMVPKGSDDMTSGVNLIMRFRLENQRPVAEFVEKAPLGLIGMKLTSPSLEEVLNLLAAAALINRSGVDLPQPLTYEGIVELAGSLA